MIDLHYLKALEQLIRTTSDSVLKHFFQHTTAQFKSDGSIVTEADLAMQSSLQKALHELSPEYLLLGEEMNVDQQRSVIDSAQAYWCLDPLDGTNNFHHGVPLYAVSVALIVDRELRIGLVYDPVRQELFSALKGTGLRINGENHQKPDQPQHMNRSLASIDFKRLKPELKGRLLTNMPFKSQRNIGTCALEWAWLAAGRIQLLLHGGEKFWDYAAGSLLVSEADGVSCGFAREPIFNNTLENRPVIAASTGELHQAWQAFLLD